MKREILETIAARRTEEARPLKRNEFKMIGKDGVVSAWLHREGFHSDDPAELRRVAVLFMRGAKALEERQRNAAAKDSQLGEGRDHRRLESEPGEAAGGPASP